MAGKPSQRDLARSGPRGGTSGGELSGGLGGSDRPDQRDPFNDNRDPDRPRTAGIFGGSVGKDGPPGNEPDPRKTGVGFLDAAEEFFQQKQAPQDITVPTERTDRRNPSDEERPRPALKPPEEDEPIIPGNPDDFGARGRRRGTRDDVNASPVLRRGLLGV